MGRPSTRQTLQLSPPEQARLEAIIAAPTRPQTPLGRARILRTLGSGQGRAETRRRTGMATPTAGRAARDGATGTGVGRRTQPHRSEDVCAVLDPGAAGRDPETAVPGIRDTLSAPMAARVHAGRWAHPQD